MDYGEQLCRDHKNHKSVLAPFCIMVSTGKLYVSDHQDHIRLYVTDVVKNLDLHTVLVS